MLDHEFQRQVDYVTSRLADQLDPDFPSQAEFMRRLGRAVQAEASDILDLYSGLTLWGGPGSVFDIDYGDAEKDREKMKLLIELVKLFESNGFHYQKARATAGIMRMWLRDWKPRD
jgi:hypothetical protein